MMTTKSFSYFQFSVLSKTSDVQPDIPVVEVFGLNGELLARQSFSNPVWLDAKKTKVQLNKNCFLEIQRGKPSVLTVGAARYEFLIDDLYVFQNNIEFLREHLGK